MKYFKHLAMAVIAIATSSIANAQFLAAWSIAYNGTANGADSASCVAVDKLGNTYIGGKAAETGSGTDMVVIKYSASGAQLWARKVPAVSNGTDIPHAIAVTDDCAFVYVTGESQGQANYQFRTAKLNSTNGDPVWNVVRDHNGQNSYADDLAINAAGHVFVTGTTRPTVGTSDILTIRYDQNGGIVSGWPQVYDRASAGLNDEGVGIAVGPSDNVFVTGIADRGGQIKRDWVTLRYAGGGGAPVWERFVTSGASEGFLKFDHPKDIVVDSLNNVFVCGVLALSDVATSTGLVSYDISGNIRYNHPTEGALLFSWEPGDSLDGANALDIEIDNTGAAVNVFLTGYGNPDGNYDFTTVAYSAAQNTGTHTWAETSPIHSAACRRAPTICTRTPPIMRDYNPIRPLLSPKLCIPTCKS